MIRKIAVVLFCLTFMACLVDNKKAMAEYEKRQKRPYRRSLSRTGRMPRYITMPRSRPPKQFNGTRGYPTAKEKLGDVYSRENKIAEAEKAYVEVKDICKKDLMCKNLDGIYDKLVLFYIYYGQIAGKGRKCHG